MLRADVMITAHVAAVMGGKSLVSRYAVGAAPEW
jgi:hypothetical protein